MGLHLLTSLGSKISGAAILGTDSQVLVKATENQHPHAGHYILNEIHSAAEKLHTKQDGLTNRQEALQRIGKGRRWIRCKKGIIDLWLIWPSQCHPQREGR